ncbi:MAG TPA: alpha/beta hydrolase [Gemmatimonadales bacterium]|nr:alpha/beta hydrolase [Gemmatimonadales bacterium]
MRRAVISTLGILAFGYAGAVAWLSWHEDALIFPVDPRSRTLVPPDPALGLEPERVETVTADGVRLVGWLMRDASPDPSALWMLIFHGNGENLSSAGRPQHYRALRALGLNLLTFDYRGYGESEGRPSEAGVYRDADAAYAYLRDSLGIPPERILIFGHSLGSAVAVDLASRVPARGIVIEGSFTSVPEVAQRIYPFFPVRLLARSRFSSIDKIGRVAMPKLFLHASVDRMTPLALGRRLYDAAAEPKAFIELAGGHADAYDADSAAYFGAIASFLR